MPTLNDILLSIEPLSIAGATDIAISALCIDSRKEAQGAVFIAVQGATTDGHAYIDTAINNGATAVAS